MSMNVGTQAHGRSPAPSEDWRNMMRQSTQEEEVIELVRDHLARWTPEEIARLPEDCRPGRIRDADDISQWAFTLASNHCAGSVPAEDEHLLDRMLEFVTRAAVRLAELRSATAGAGVAS
jgi:hypothetical protein